MLSETLAKGLNGYAIGEKLRGLRLKKKMGLVELGRHTGLSAAMLSKVERGKLFPTLPTLLRISLVFSVGLEYFFSDEKKRHILAIVRRVERKRFPERAEGRDVILLVQQGPQPLASPVLLPFAFEQRARKRFGNQVP